MSLLTCPDCQRQLSDRAAACPHCGRPHSSPILSGLKLIVALINLVFWGGLLYVLFQDALPRVAWFAIAGAVVAILYYAAKGR
jgi:primosomal protein N'